ncbi:hypothetical protein, partial [Cryptosporidium hominis TU502]
MAPKYILSFLCLQYPTGQVQTNKKTDSDGSLEIFITSKENSMVVDVPDSEYVHEGAVLLGIWNDNTVFLRFEATKEIHKVKTAYPKPQMIGQRFQGGSSLVIIEISAPLTPQNTIPENQTSYFSHVEPLRDNSISTLEQSEKDESNREASVSGFEVDQSIQQLDTSPAKLDESVENEHFESQDPLPTYIHTDKDELQEVSNSRIIPIHEKQPIETALDNSAITYAIMMRNQIKKSKLHNLNKNFDLVNQKAKWIVRAPCSGTITSKKLTRNIKKILQGTLYATIQCNSKGRGKGAFENKGKEMALIMPFSIKINKIKADLQETEQPGLYSAQVSKNQSIITGKLIKESKDIPPHLI